jgi:hypothetical protein
MAGILPRERAAQMVQAATELLACASSRLDLIAGLSFRTRRVQHGPLAAALETVQCWVEAPRYLQHFAARLSWILDRGAS